MKLKQLLEQLKSKFCKHKTNWVHQIIEDKETGSIISVFKCNACGKKRTRNAI